MKQAKQFSKLWYRIKKETKQKTKHIAIDIEKEYKADYIRLLWQQAKQNRR